MRSRVAVRGERRINANDPRRPQSRPRRRVHVLCADGGESARARREDRARAAGHRDAQPPLARGGAGGHRRLVRDVPLIADRYRMMDPGASMGKGYGPILVAREPIPAVELEQRVTAIAGKHTTSALLLRLYVGDPPLIEAAFDKIPPAVLEGQADLGLLIHADQSTSRTMS